MRKPNKLLNETSPYLLQHAYNPVQWYPWSEEAFNIAKQENKPIFLSIGYSTCHWCHVMERESFEDEEVAGILNKHFISIKVDKEERPDVDAVYMDVCQSLTGSGGWPLSIFMTPEQKPFFAGTYFPKKPRYGQPGFIDLLNSIYQKWVNEQDELLRVSESITSQMRAFIKGTKAQDSNVDKDIVLNAIKYFERSFDERYGGFGQAPKFPQPHNLLFLLRCHYLGLGEESLNMVENTLQAMIRGGIFDHIGYGFSRYSTDKMWLAPHFEKMLYDNALIVMALLECWQITQNEVYKYAAQKTLYYIKREMTSPNGAFYSAEDADSEGEEGKFYTFSRDEIFSVLGKDDAEYFCEVYNITERGNFEGKNIPNLISSAKNFLMEPNLEMMREKLYEYRKKRFVIHKDDKVLTSWNTLMITAYAKAYVALGKEEYLKSAISCFDFIMKNMRDEKDRFYISHREGISKGDGLLDDYAFMAWAALSLYDASLDEKYLIHACDIAKRVLESFSSDEGGFFLSPDYGEKLLLRSKEQYDGAIPSGNSVMLYCFSRLWHLSGDMQWREETDRQIAFFSKIFNKHPASSSFALCGFMQDAYPAERLVCVGRVVEKKSEIVEKIFGKIYRPFAAVLTLTGENEEELSSVAVTAQEYKNAPDGFYLCRREECLPAVDSFEKALKLMGKESEFV